MIDEVQLDIDGGVGPCPTSTPNHEALIKRKLIDALPLPRPPSPRLRGERPIIRNFAELLALQQLFARHRQRAGGAADEILGELEARPRKASWSGAEPTIDRIVRCPRTGADDEVQKCARPSSARRGSDLRQRNPVDVCQCHRRDRNPRRRGCATPIDDFFQEPSKITAPGHARGRLCLAGALALRRFLIREEIKERIPPGSTRPLFTRPPSLMKCKQFLKAQLYEVDALIQDAVAIRALHTINHHHSRTSSPMLVAELGRLPSTAALSAPSGD